MRIGIMTGGGDVPGLNACIKTLVNRMIDEGHTATGIRRGWRGLLQFNPADPTSHYENTFPLNKNIVRSIDRSGGTILHTSRLNPGALDWKDVPEFLRGSVPHEPDGSADYTQHILDVLAFLKLDALIPIGGDDTLAYASQLDQAGFPIISIPKTMDNDVTGTDYCLGFSTAITRCVAAIQELRTTVASHERIGVIEVFGRYSGELSLISAFLSGANRAIIPEVPFDPRRLADLLAGDLRSTPTSYAMMTISEGARMTGDESQQFPFTSDVERARGASIGARTAALLEDLAGIPTVFVQLSFLLRAGSPDTLDRMVALNFANTAMDLVKAGQFGRMVAINNGRYSHVPASSPAQGPRRVEVGDLYEVETYRPNVFTTVDKPIFLY